MNQDIFMLAMLIPTYFIVKATANNFGAGYGVLAFVGMAAVAGVLAGQMGIEVVGSDCYDYGVRAKGC